MDRFFDIIAQGIAQGLTEFLPVSSSGHIAIVDYFTSQSSDILHVSIVLHAGTLVSLIIYFWKQIKLKTIGLILFEKDAKIFTANIVSAMIPIIFIGFVFGDMIGDKYNSEYIVLDILPYTYFIMGLILFSAKHLPLKKISTTIFPALAFLIGCVQVLAIFPGISRAGITISAFLIFGVSRKDAAEFSFLVGIPTLFGAIILDIVNQGLSITIIDCIGFVVSMIVGYLAIHLVFHLLSKSKFWYFSFYCWLLSLISIMMKIINV